MKVVVVYAHPNPMSFNHALRERFTQGLQDAGHDFEIIDLYDLEFDPAFSMEDFAQFGEGEQPQDVLSQQRIVADGQAMALIFPVWWWGYPALLKGWADRVFSHGFAYKMTEEGGIQGILPHKKVLLISTTMAPEAMYKSMGLNEAMTKLDRATFTAICGIEDVKHVFLYQAATDAEAREKYLNLAYRLGKEF
jgi:NAD(P)H dehydrogenase (quinone)